MAFAGINDELRRHTKRLQSVPEFVGLRSRAFRVALTCNDKRWGLYVLDEANGRTFLIHTGVIVNRCAEEWDHPLIDQVLTIVTLPVCNARAGDCCPKTVGLRHCPHGHITAVAPASHAETRRVDWIFFYRRIDPRQYVAKIAAAKVFHVSAGKRLSLAVTATRVRHQHIITA